MTLSNSNEPGGKRSAHPKGRQVEAGAVKEIRSLFGSRVLKPELLIEHLHVLQDEFGYLSPRHMAALASEMRLAQAEIFEVASFYHHFHIVKEDAPAPSGTTLRVCDGIACAMAGADKLIEEMRDFSGSGLRVLTAPCMGGCDKAPVATLGKRQLAWATAQSIKESFEKGLTSPVIPQYAKYHDYVAKGGYGVLRDCLAGKRDRESVIGEIELAGLRGLGGAGFPTAAKWRFVEGSPEPPVLVINADEGEPGTFKDRHCLETDPHKVLEGMLITAWTIRAREIFFYLRDEYAHIRDLLIQEIDKIRAAGLTKDFEIILRRGAGAYVCGEESALLESLEGKRGLPRNRPPYPAQQGLFGRPTIINNVETMYWIQEIMAHGAALYMEHGRPRFYSVPGKVRNPGVVRAPGGTTARQLIDEHCGGMIEEHVFKAFLPGGASGGILPASMADLPLDFGVLEEYGCFVGSAALIVLSDSEEIRAVVRNLISFFADESCGQCTPCRVGCEKMLILIDQPVWDEALINELSETMRDASICGLGQAAPNPVETALKFFGGELA